MATADFRLLDALIRPAQAGDEAARDQLIHLGYAMVRIQLNTKGYYLHDYSSDQDDLTQIGMIGFIQAINDWRPNHQKSFRWFAHMCVDREIIGALRGADREKRRVHKDMVYLNAPFRDEGVYGDGAYAARLEKCALPDPSGLTRDPADIADNSEAEALVKIFCERLSSLEHKVFIYALMREKSFHETAAILNRSWKSIDNAVQRIQAKAVKIVLTLLDDERFTVETRSLLRRVVEPGRLKFRRNRGVAKACTHRTAV